MEKTTKAMPETVEKALEAKLKAMKADPCGITPEAIESLLDPAREANAVLNDAMAAYENDLTSRRSELDKQAADLDVKIQTLKSKICAMEDKSREAASRGDLDTSAYLDEEAEGLRKQLSTTSRKRRIATSTELKGDKSLFMAITAAKMDYEAAEEAGQKYVREARAAVDEWSKFFEHLQDKVKFVGRYGPNMDTRRFEKIDHHFNAEFYARMAEKQKAEDQERKDAWEAEKARRRATGNFFCL